MRTLAQIEQVINQARTGYVLIQQQFPTERDVNLFQQNTAGSVYLRLSECKRLLFAIQFEGLSLAQRNELADRLVRGKFLANQQMSQLYVQNGYTENEYVNFTQ